MTNHIYKAGIIAILLSTSSAVSAAVVAMDAADMAGQTKGAITATASHNDTQSDTASAGFKVAATTLVKETGTDTSQGTQDQANGTDNHGTSGQDGVDGASDNSGSDNSGSDNGGSDNGGSDNGGSDNGGSDNGGSDNGGSDNGGSDNGGGASGGGDNGGGASGGGDNGGGDNGGGDNGGGDNGGGDD